MPDPLITGRTLVALEGGPRSNHWYWLEDWHILRRSVQAQFPPDDPVAADATVDEVVHHWVARAALHYQPTGRHIDNSNPRYGHGEVWLYTPPENTSVHVIFSTALPGKDSR
jgi:hypothetical protein